MAKEKEDIFLYHKKKEALKTDLLEKDISERTSKKKIKILSYFKNKGKYKIVKVKKKKRSKFKAYIKSSIYNIKDDDGETTKQILISSRKMYQDYRILSYIPKNAGKLTIKVINDTVKGIISKNKDKAKSKELENNKINKPAKKNKINRQVDNDKLRREMLNKSKPRKNSVGSNKGKFIKSSSKNLIKHRKNPIRNKKHVFIDYLNYRVTNYSNRKDVEENFNKSMVETSKQYYKVYKSSAMTVMSVANTIKNIGMAAAVIISSKIGIVIVIAVTIFLLISSIFGAQISLLPINFILCDDEYRERFIGEVEVLQEKANNDLKDRISSSKYDDVRLVPSNLRIDVDYRYLLAIITVKYNQIFEEESLEEIKKIYDLFYAFNESTETYYEMRDISWIDEFGVEHTDSVKVEKTRLIISYYTRSILQVADELNFTDEEIEWLNCLLSSEFGSSGAAAGRKTSLTEEEIQEMYSMIGNIEDIKRRELIETAMTLWGITSYKWGGKSKADVEFPTGLDCSGFVDWVYKRSLGYTGLSFGGTAYQFGVGSSISQYNLKAGDLGFWKTPSQVSGDQTDANHVGIYICTLSNGKDVYIHSEGGTGVTINSFSFRHFKTITDANLN